MARVLAGITLAAALMLTLGIATPLAAVVSLAGLISAVNRAPLNVFGLDDTLGMLLIAVAVGPAGAVLSVDRLLAPDIAAATSAPVEAITRAVNVEAFIPCSAADTQ
jgi:hypothetical protein